MSCPAPRWGTPRRLLRPTRGALLAQIAALLGWELHDWQQLAADVSLEYDPMTRTPAYGVVGIAVARQNGKTTLVCARIALQLIVPGANRRLHRAGPQPRPVQVAGACRLAHGNAVR